MSDTESKQNGRKASRASLGALFLTVFLDLVGFGIVIPVIPIYAREMGDSAIAGTALMSAYSLFQLIFSPIWGRISDRVGRRPVLLVSIAGALVANLLFGFVGSLWALFVARSLAGASGANISTAQAYIADITTPEERARGMGLIGAAFGLGFVLGPAIGGIAQQFGNSHTPFFVAAFLSLINLVYVALLLPEPERKAQRSHRAILSQARSLTEKPNRQRQIMTIIVLYFAIGFAFANFEATFSFWSTDIFGYAQKGISFLFTFIGVCMVVVQGGVVRRLVKVTGEPRLIFLGTMLMGIGLMTLPLTAHFVVLPLLLALLAVIATGSGLNGPSITALLSRSVEEGRQGEVLGIAQSAASLSRILGPLCGGALYQHVGRSAPFLASGVLLVLLSLASLKITKTV